MTLISFFCGKQQRSFLSIQSSAKMKNLRDGFKYYFKNMLGFKTSEDDSENQGIQEEGKERSNSYGTNRQYSAFGNHPPGCTDNQIPIKRAGTCCNNEQVGNIQNNGVPVQFYRGNLNFDGGKMIHNGPGVQPNQVRPSPIAHVPWNPPNLNQERPRGATSYDQGKGTPNPGPSGKARDSLKNDAADFAEEAQKLMKEGLYPLAKSKLIFAAERTKLFLDGTFLLLTFPQHHEWISFQ